MWLYTVIAWSAQTENPYSSMNKMDGVEERQESWLCRSKHPNDGLRLLKEYSDAFKYGTRRGSVRHIVEYRLLSMAEIPDDTDAELMAALGAHEIDRDAIDSVLT